jgi:hypothetical protein
MKVLSWQPDIETDRTFLGLSSSEDLDASVAGYAKQVVESQDILRRASAI